MKRTLLIFVAAISSFIAFGQTSILHCGKLIDVNNNTVINEQSIIIENNLISDVVPGYKAATEGEIVIDLKDKVVMPGLMDMHVHIESQLNPKTYENRFRNDPADIALQATQYCKKTLQAGFTTVRDLGGTGVNVSLRDAIRKGYIEGPRILTAEKGIGTTGGHADPTNGVKSDLLGDPGPKEGVINGPEDAYKAVRQRYKNGADCIKITSTGGVLSVAKDGSGPQFTIAEIKAIVAAAKDYGYVTAAHAHGKEGMKRAILGGINSIEHGTLMDEEIMDLMVEKGTYLVPTLLAGAFVSEKAKIPGYFPPVIVPKAIFIGEQMKKSFGIAYRKGVKIAYGTDTGVSAHGDNAQEFTLMTEYGMPAIETIQCATKNAAELMNIYETVGSLENGKFADIIAVEEDPRDNINTMLDVSFVMKNGVIYKSK